jgi:hypothetical protein
MLVGAKEGRRDKRVTLGYWNKDMIDTIEEALLQIERLNEQLTYTTDPLMVKQIQLDISQATLRAYRALKNITVEQPPKFAGVALPESFSDCLEREAHEVTPDGK